MCLFQGTQPMPPAGQTLTFALIHSVLSFLSPSSLRTHEQSNIILRQKQHTQAHTGFPIQDRLWASSKGTEQLSLAPESTHGD